MLKIFGVIFVVLLVVVTVIALFAIYVLGVVGLINVSWLTSVDEIESQGPIIVERSAPREYIISVINRDISDDNLFDILISEEDANGLLNGELGPGAPVRELTVEMRAGKVRVDGELKGRFRVPFGASLAPHVGPNGDVQIELSDLSLAVFPVPEFVSGALNDMTNQIVNFNRLLSEQGTVTLTTVAVSPQGLRLAGSATEPIQLPDGATPGVPTEPLPPIPAMRARAELAPAVSPSPEAWTYLAIGDSLTEGVGASEASRNFPTRFHQYLNQTFGVPLRLENIGISGESSANLMQGAPSQLDRAIQIVSDLENDGDPNTRVHVISLTMGANDVFPVLKGPKCFSNPVGVACEAELDSAVALFEQNMDLVMDRLTQVLPPDTLVLIMRYYNPFNFGTGLIFEDVSQDTVDKLNLAVDRVAQKYGMTVADVGALYGDLAFGITHIGQGDIHPTDEGYAVMTRAFQDSYEQVGPFPR